MLELLGSKEVHNVEIGEKSIVIRLFLSLLLDGCLHCSISILLTLYWFKPLVLIPGHRAPFGLLLGSPHKFSGRVHMECQRSIS